MNASRLPRPASLPPWAIRLLPRLCTDGPHQMAADEVMLESAVAGTASLRLYSWDPPTLSLGYFQRHRDRLLDPQLAQMAWVRRATGGGAIIHASDLTYAIALPSAFRRGASPAQWHHGIHDTLASLLRHHDVAAVVAEGTRLPQAELDFLCFAVPQPGDVVLNGAKVVGGAQRVRAGALLQHGSIQLPSLKANAGEMGRSLAAALGWEVTENDWTSLERGRIEELAARKYSQEWWNCKR